MKKILTLGTLLLGCCLAAAAQSQTPATPQSGEAAANAPAAGQSISGQSAIPADSSQATTLRGCLSQSSDGNFMLADNSGNNFQLRGDTSQLSSYIGKEVQVHGIGINSSGTNAGAMSSDATGTSAGTAKQFTVNDVHKVSDACAASK